MLLSKVTCPACHKTFVAADAHVTVPRAKRSWWHLSGERSEYLCPSCKAFVVLQLHPLAILGALAIVAGSAIAHLVYGYPRGACVAVGGTAIVIVLRFGLRPRSTDAQ